MITAVIFDIDGTLIDSVDLLAEAWRVSFARFGTKVTFEEVRRQIGKGGDQLMPVFLSLKELAKFGEELEQFRGDLCKKEFLPRVNAFPGVRQLFQRIQQDDKRIAVASSAKGDELRLINPLPTSKIWSRSKPRRMTPKVALADPDMD